MLHRIWMVFVLVAGLAGRLGAEPVPLIDPAGIGQAAPLFSAGDGGALIASAPHPVTERVSSGSLFAGTIAASLFAPLPPRPRRGQVDRALALSGTVADRLRNLIGRAEAGALGYDAVQYGARVRPALPPTRMTLAQIDAWTRATPGQPHAIGRYQFIPATLRRLVGHLGLPPETVFSPEVQDRLADLLLEEAGLSATRAGDMSVAAYMHNLAQIWAGLPTANGQSFYHGFAGNRATLSWGEFQREMARIFLG